MHTDTPLGAPGPEPELNVTCSINSDLYPDLYALLTRQSKGPRSELLRALANEALTTRRIAAAAATQRTHHVQGPDDSNGVTDRQRG